MRPTHLDRALSVLCALIGIGALSLTPEATRAAGLGAQPESGEDTSAQEPSERERRRQRALRRLGENDPSVARRAEASDPAALPLLDPELVAEFERIITYIADPAREGRAPGTDGIEDAADFLDREFERIGLEPAFEGGASYRQEMEYGASLDATTEEFAINGLDLRAGEDFAALAFSGSASASGPVVFTGYAIRSGPDGYEGFPGKVDLDGSIAMCLEHEPMDESGASRWREDGWSNRSRLSYKVNALANRGAEGVLIVSTPGADDPGAGTLETLESTAPPAFMGSGSSGARFEIPVVSITPEAARTILIAADTDETLEALIGRSNAGGVIEPMDSARVRLDIELERSPTLTDNLGAVLEGRGALADEFIVIGAHYDHVGYGRFGSRMRDAAGIVHPGADDNASGTTGLLIAARQLADRYALLDESDNARSILFLLFTAEESGLNGSRYYADNPIAPIEDHEIMLNLDMIGSLERDPLEVGGLDSSDDLESVALTHLEASGVVFAQDVSVGRGRSDHASFDAEKVPNLFLFTGLHERYHLPQDTVDHVDMEGAVRVATICAQIAYDAATDPRDFTHDRSGGADQRAQREPPKVRIGIVPSNATGGGMTILRVFDGTSADEAGLEARDRITHWDGEEIESVESWSPVLLEHEPGDVVTLRVERAGETLEVEMTLKAAD